MMTAEQWVIELELEAIVQKTATAKFYWTGDVVQSMIHRIQVDALESSARAIEYSNSVGHAQYIIRLLKPTETL